MDKLESMLMEKRIMMKTEIAEKVVEVQDGGQEELSKPEGNIAASKLLVGNDCYRTPDSGHITFNS